MGFAWAGFGSAFGPIILAMLYWKRLNAPGAIAGMVTGAVVSIVWGSTALGDIIYEIVPGFALAAIVMVVVSLLTKAPSQEITDEFATAARLSTASNMADEEAAFSELAREIKQSPRES